MSLAQLKEKAAALSPQERIELAEFLADLEEQGEDDLRRTVDQRMMVMDSGKKVSGDQFEAEHARCVKK